MTPTQAFIRRRKKFERQNLPLFSKDLDSTPAMETSEDLKLTELPPEILVHIFGFLDAGFVRTVLSRVNRRLAQLVADPIIWKMRIAARWPAGKYPPVIPEEPPWDWARACSAREKFHNQWSKHETTKAKVRVKGHYSSVDTIMLMNQGLLVTGSRDRSLGKSYKRFVRKRTLLVKYQQSQSEIIKVKILEICESLKIQIFINVILNRYGYTHFTLGLVHISTVNMAAKFVIL